MPHRIARRALLGTATAALGLSAPARGQRRGTVRPYVRRQASGGPSYDARGEPEGCPRRRASPQRMEDEPWRRLAQFSSGSTQQS